MTGDAPPASPPAQPLDPTGALADTLTSYFRRPCRIRFLSRRPYAYSTSHLLEELDVQLEDGTTLQLLVKHLSRTDMLEEARLSKPAFLHDPQRESEVYRSLLAGEELGTPVCFGVIDGADSHDLLLEKVDGRELYQVGEATVWADVARWLAGLHTRFGSRVDELRRSPAPLLHYNAAYYNTWLHRALAFLRNEESQRRHAALSTVSAGLAKALDHLARAPLTLLHGELYASNVLIADEAAGRRICAVDWEMAGVGPGMLDLAALSSGWDETTRRALALAYRAALPPVEGWPPAESEFLYLLDCGELCLAVQWLGWAPRWSAPPEQARNWWERALQVSERLSV